MADGNTHFKHSVIVTGILAVGAIPLGIVPEVLLAGIAGTFYGPDIDMESSTKTESIIPDLIYELIAPISTWLATQIKRIVLTIIKLLTIPYALLIPHRSFLSHLPPICTIIRLYYVNIIWNGYNMGVTWWVFWPTWVLNKGLVFSDNLEILGVFFVVMCILDSIHLIDDGGMYLLLGKRYLFGKRFYDKKRK